MTTNKYEHLPRAGDTQNNSNQTLFYLSPLPLPTGVTAFSSRKLQQYSNTIYMDYTLGGGSFEFAIRCSMCIIFGMTLLLFLIGFLPGLYAHFYFERPILEGLSVLFAGSLFVPTLLLSLSLLFGIPIVRAIFLLTRTPPIRFNRQRREVAYVAKRGQPPHIIPWESVIACVSNRTTITEYGNQENYALMISLYAPNEGQIVSLTIASSTPTCAISEWEAIRFYMEEGPYTSTKRFDLSELESQQGTVEYFQLCRRIYHKDNGYLMYLFGFVFLQALGGWTLPCHITAWIQRLPRTSFPKSIREWSKPLPEEQWQQPSAELVEQSKEVQKALRRGKTLIDYFADPFSPTADPKPGSITARRKRRTQANS